MVHAPVAELAARHLTEKLSVGVPLSASEAEYAGYCIECLVAFVPHTTKQGGACAACGNPTLPLVSLCYTHLKIAVETSVQGKSGTCARCHEEQHTRLAVWDDACYYHLTTVDGRAL